jgi:hypothetical protein
MLLKLGTGMMIFAVAFAAVVALMVNLSGADEPAPSETAVKLRAAESPTEQEEVFDVGETSNLTSNPVRSPKQPKRRCKTNQSTTRRSRQKNSLR